ncbi:MAG TPA: hypothetical protein CFH84_01590 [Sulfurimonas sp. UBA12504]|nr:MAG TPA: hypothetical protein CFH84_01590 [Sulfurimonas sp. UBA12504]
MKSFVSAFFMMFVFGGCVSSSLSLQEPQGIVLTQERQTIVTQAQVEEKIMLRFTNLDVTQIRVSNAAKEKLFFEELEANHDYEFKYATVETLKRVFDLSYSRTLYQSSSLLFVQLQRKDGSYINILAEKSSFQRLSYVYGYSNAAFEALAQELGVVLQTSHTNILAFEEPQTQWSQSDMFLNPLVQPIYRKYGIAF